MSSPVEAERRCNALLGNHLTGTRPERCGKIAWTLCAACGTALCETHEMVCQHCDRSFCSNCEHVCRVAGQAA